MRDDGLAVAEPKLDRAPCRPQVPESGNQRGHRLTSTSRPEMAAGGAASRRDWRHGGR